MDIPLLNKISDLTFYGFINPANNIVTVHFFNEQNDKPDIIAYLRRDMSWDVREIVDEISELKEDREVVEILHEPLGIEEHNGKFDKFVRLGLTKMAEEVHGDDVKLEDIDPMFMVFKDNSYDDEG